MLIARARRQRREGFHNHNQAGGADHRTDPADSSQLGTIQQLAPATGNQDAWNQHLVRLTNTKRPSSLIHYEKGPQRRQVDGTAALATRRSRNRQSGMACGLTHQWLHGKRPKLEVKVVVFRRVMQEGHFL